MAKLTFPKKTSTTTTTGTAKKPQLFDGGKNLLTNLDDDAWDQALGDTIKKSSEGRMGDFISFFDRELVKSLFKHEWEPKPGDHVIEIIPYLTGALDRGGVVGKPTHFCDCRVHFSVGPKNGAYNCLLEMWGLPCPVCEWREKLRAKGYDKEVWKPFFPKVRSLYNILCLDNREELRKGIQFWHVSWHYMEKKLAIVAKKSQVSSLFDDSQSDEPITTYTQFSHPIKGKTINFRIDPPVSKDDYESYEGHSFSDREHDLIPKLVASAVPLDKLLIKPEYGPLREEFHQNIDEEELQERAAKQKEADEGPSGLGADIAELLKQSGVKPIDKVGWGDLGGGTSCEYGGEFGVNTGELDACNECENWEACVEAKKPKATGKKPGLKLKFK